MEQKTICVLGGGIGGVVAANLIKKGLDNSGRVILIDKNPDHIFAPSFLWIVDGKREPEQIKRPLKRLERKGIEFVQGEIAKIDPADNSILVGDQTIKYDYLVVALGAESNMGAIDNLDDAAINFYSLDGILRLKKELQEFKGEDVVVLIPSSPYKCPAAPYEAAFLIDSKLRAMNKRAKTNISICTVEGLPMPGAGPEVGQMIKGLLSDRGIDFKPTLEVDSIDPKLKTITFKGGERQQADLLITVPPHKSPDVVKEAGLTNEAGWIPVDKKTLETKFRNIFAVGDITAIKLEGRYKPEKQLMVPKAGVFAHAEA
ncbi:MAG: NAD(P)/FAD-dependent oxidoreductase, partial [Actinomycetia bacterium]|nr:NAD(P)/FAD-dependent oxidoreductase [Actinomycetes bacterium]